MGSTVLVTGSSGFLGRATVRALEGRGHQVLPFDQHPPPGWKVRDVRMHPLDQCDAVIHLAGVLGTSELFDDPHRAVDVNVGGTAHVLTECERLGAAYVGITMPQVWANVYSATKRCALDLAEAWRRHRGLRVAHVRAFNVYGPGQAVGDGTPGHPQKIVPTFASRSWAGLPMPVWGDGSQTVDLVHVDDVAGLLVGAVEGLFTEAVGNNPFDGAILDAASGTSHTVLEVAEMVGHVTGCYKVRHLPMRPGEHPVVFESAPLCRGFDADRFIAAVESYKPVERRMGERIDDMIRVNEGAGEAA
jgi:UDP-glucose 4-epimerase